jgi:hypothetical protein
MTAFRPSWRAAGPDAHFPVSPFPLSDFLLPTSYFRFPSASRFLFPITPLRFGCLPTKHRLSRSHDCPREAGLVFRLPLFLACHRASHRYTHPCFQLFSFQRFQIFPQTVRAKFSATTKGGSLPSPAPNLKGNVSSLPTFPPSPELPTPSPWRAAGPDAHFPVSSFLFPLYAFPSAALLPNPRNSNQSSNRSSGDPAKFPGRSSTWV